MQKWKAGLIHDGYQFKKNHVLVTEDDGRVVDVIPEQEAGSDIPFMEGIVCPGFVNTHCHLELSHLKGRMAEHTGLVPFLMAVMKERNDFKEDVILEAAANAEDEMLKNGIAAVGDIANGTDSIRTKKRGKLYYHTFVECLGITDSKATASFQRSLQVLNAFREAGLSAGMVPHAPYSVSRSLFRLINENNPYLLSIHNQETPDEDSFYKGSASGFYKMFDTFGLDYTDFQPTGKSSLRSYLPSFTRDQPIILVHNTFTSEAEITEVQNGARHCYWCLCPNANLYIENKMPPVNELRKHNATITLGTDSLASNYQLSILSEIQTLQKYFPQLSLEEMLRWATSNGAKALHCDGRFGSFEKGKKPGIVLLQNTEGNFLKINRTENLLHPSSK